MLTWASQVIKALVIQKKNMSFLIQMINIIFDFYIHLGIEMAEEYSINKCFGQSSKMHFKTLFVSIKRLLVKNETFNPSQLMLIHYTLLTSEKLIKFITEPLNEKDEWFKWEWIRMNMCENEPESIPMNHFKLFRIILNECKWMKMNQF